MRYLFRGLIRVTGKTVEGAVEADTPEDALTALSANGIVTEDLTPAPMPISGFSPSARAAYAPQSAGGAGAPPVPPGTPSDPSNGANGSAAAASASAGAGGFVPAENVAHPGLNSDDPVERAFAAASQAVSFDAVAQRYKGKSVWVIDRDRIRRQVAGIVDQALQQAEGKVKDQNRYDGDQVRESVASALKEMFKDNANIASQQTPEQARAAQQAAQGKQAQPAPQASQAPQAAPQRVVATSSPQLEEQVGRLEAFLARAETVLTQLQVAAKRVGTGGGGGGGGFAPRRMSHIPKPRGEEADSVLLEIFKSNVKLRDNLAAKTGGGEPEAIATDEQQAEAGGGGRRRRRRRGGRRGGGVGRGVGGGGLRFGPPAASFRDCNFPSRGTSDTIGRCDAALPNLRSPRPLPRHPAGGPRESYNAPKMRRGPSHPAARIGRYRRT